MSLKIAVVGPFPPPLHGSSKNLISITEEIEESINVTRISTSPAKIRRGLKYHLLKITRVVAGLVHVIFNRFNRSYMTVDAGLGMLYSIAFILVFKTKGIDVVIHHRSFSYINKRSVLMKFLSYLSGNCCHVFLCEHMKQEFIKRYGQLEEVLVVSNAQQVTPLASLPSRSKDGVIRIGYLSNLSVEKGFCVAVDVFLKLQEQGVKAHFIIAGPASDKESEVALAGVSEKYPEFVDYRGAVYGVDKTCFFKDIDVLLFPTNYENEAQPNVLFEAMAGGSAILSTMRGCIPGDIIQEVGLVVDFEDYLPEACKYIELLVSNPDKLTRVKQSSLESIAELKQTSLHGHELLIKRLVSKVSL